MPDAYGNPTPEEKMRMLIAKANAGKSGGMSPASTGMTPGMVSQEDMALASQDLSSQQDQIAKQRQYAQQLSSTPGAQGVRAGDVYAAPTWTAQLASAIRQGTGAYGQYKAGQGEGALNEQQAEVDAAKGRVAAGTYGDARADAADAQANALAKLGLQEDTLAQTIAADNAAAANRGATLAQTIARDNSMTENQRATRDQARANSAVEMVKLDEEGNPIASNTKYATKRPDGLYFGDEKVDESTWQSYDNPNLQAATVAGTKPTAASKKAQYLSEVYDEATANLFNLMENGFDPTSPAALWDKLASKSDVANFLASEQGQQWEADVETAKDSALRTATGAAAPGTEQARQVLALIPRPGDKTGTLARKKVKLKVYGDALRRLGNNNPDMSPDDLVALAVSEARKVGNDIKDEPEEGWKDVGNGVKLRVKGS